LDTESFTGGSATSLRSVQRALEAVQHDPAAAHADALLVLARLPAEARTSTPADRFSRAVTLWALGRAEYELGNLRESRRRLREGVAAAGQAADEELRSSIRTSLAVTLLELGDTSGALQQLAEALPHARPDNRGRALTQRAFIWYTLGRYDKSLEDAGSAQPLLADADDRLGLARLLINRGICHLAMGELPAAESDLTRSRQIAAELKQDLIVAACDQNLGCLFAAQQRLPEALQSLNRARADYARLGSPGRVMAALDADLAGTLLAAGLHGEAVEAAQRSIDQATEHANRVQMAEARLALANALSAAGRSADSAKEAQTASRLFRQSQRYGAGLLAEHVALENAAATMDLDSEVPPLSREFRAREAAGRRALELVGELERLGWHLEAAQARTLAGTLACSTGDLAAARTLLTGATGRIATTSQRVRRWHSLARLCLLEGNLAAARRALRSGLEAVAAQRALLGATELRVHSAASAEALAATGLGLALRSRRPADVLEWSEHGRAASLRSETVQPPTEPELAALLAELRHRRTQRLASLDDAPEAAANRQIVELERAIIERTRLLPATATADRAIPSLDNLCERLGARTLISFHEHDGRLGAVVVTQGHARLHDIGHVADIENEQAYLDSAVRRTLLTAGGGRPTAGWRVAAQRFSDLLLGSVLLEQPTPAASASEPSRIPPSEQPLRFSRHDPVVVVPTGSLHSVSWGLLPALRHRPFVVAPSVAAWFHRPANLAAQHTSRVGIAVGPGLPGADREGALIAELHPNATLLVGESASVEATLTLLAQSDIVHLAAHGRFRNDSPLFSAVDLSDGQMTVVEIERLTTVANTIVLPVCNAATAAVRAGDELIGPTAALLRLGVRTVVAPARPIPDEASVDLMLGLHRLMIAGRSAAESLAELRTHHDGDDLTALSAGLMACFGAD
jgi:tetratricopeptide (TPR) repeat protein